MKRTIMPFARMAWNHLFTILHINYVLSCEAFFFRIIHTNYLLPVTLLQIAWRTATVTMETYVFPTGATSDKWAKI